MSQSQENFWAEGWKDGMTDGRTLIHRTPLATAGGPIIRIQCSWIRRLFDDNLHGWKVIPLFLTKGSSEKILNFIIEILTRWSRYLSFPVSLPSTTIS